MKALIPSLMVHGLFLALLLGCAGRWNYWPAWIYVATGLTLSLLTRLVLRSDRELLEERTKLSSTAKSWDKRLLGIGFLLTLITLVVAGLDAGRYRFTPTLTWPYCVAGLSCNVAGTAIFLRAMKENRFFSSVVRIQSERGHSVCHTGPYSVVRHPGYSGMILGSLGLPLLLMSAWCAIPTLLFVLVMVVRTQREDSCLQAELDGYREYCNATRYRLVPGAW
jgi:protein-S-isoprenylcysteine O-methyltransferase Ste14